MDMDMNETMTTHRMHAKSGFWHDLKIGRVRSIRRVWMVLMMLFAFGILAFSQTSLPAPGSGGSFKPDVSPNLPAHGIGWNPAPWYGSSWNRPWWNTGWNNGPTIVVRPVVNVNGNFQNQGIVKVVASGYDAEGVWRVLPLVVSYQWQNGRYTVYVLNAWNPWTNRWEQGVDEQAYPTNYYLHGQRYHYYVSLLTGTFFFNL